MNRRSPCGREPAETEETVCYNSNKDVSDNIILGTLNLDEYKHTYYVEDYCRFVPKKYKMHERITISPDEHGDVEIIIRNKKFTIHVRGWEQRARRQA